VVALFVDPDPGLVVDALARVRIDVLQFHGNEPPELCGSFGRPWIKAVRMREGVDLWAARRRYGAASALLLDAYQPGVPGGTGRRFDWGRIPRELASTIVLAGGIDPTNVVEAVRAVRPFAVDVSGGVERERGVKDAEKIAALFRGVRRGDDEGP
jgi:phosphoribosylanthranilate isomerase